MSVPVESLAFRVATLDEIYHLRFAVLRPGMTPERVYFAGDDAPSPAALHFGAFVVADPRTIVACLTLLESSYENQPAYQLRGMAVDEAYRSRGIGAQLLAHAEKHIFTHTPVRTLWCNARVPALNFYLRQGWSIVSEKFEIPTAGPHRKMYKGLNGDHFCGTSGT